MRLLSNVEVFSKCFGRARRAARAQRAARSAKRSQVAAPSERHAGRSAPVDFQLALGGSWLPGAQLPGAPVTEFPETRAQNPGIDDPVKGQSRPIVVDLLLCNS